MALPLPVTPTEIGALTPNTRSEAEAAFAVGPHPHSPISIQSLHHHNHHSHSHSHDCHHSLYNIHTSASSSPVEPQFNAMHQTSSSGPPKPFVPHQDYPMQRRLSHNYLDAANEAGLPPSTCEPPYPTEQTAEQVKGNLSRGTTQAVLQKMDSLTKIINSSGETRAEHTHVTFAGQTTTSGPELDAGTLNKRLAREGHRRTSSITVPVPADLKTTIPGNTTAENVFERPSFDRSMSWKREDKKRALYQQEKLMEEERRNGKNYGYDSAGEEGEPKYAQF
jgi:hypothetical protein